MFVPVHGMGSIEDLLRGIIIQSGNDSCIVIAEGLSGSEEGFVEEMNQKVQEIGAFDTHFVNSHGLHKPNHYSTTYDLDLIGMCLIDNFPEYYSLHNKKLDVMALKQVIPMQEG